MDYISDSDGDNSLPVLSPDAVDREQLRAVLFILSEGSRARIRRESGGTAMERLYDELLKQGPQTETSGGFNPQVEAEVSLQMISEAVAPFSLLDSANLPDISDHIENTRNTTGEIRQEESSTHNEGSEEPNASRRSRRSLRKRTFASRHPYIADQADWLGICTVDSINEMFNGDEDVTKVVRALNQLYLKRKKRYPDEDRYKARNFYAHLGKSKLMALTGDLAEHNKIDDLNSQDEKYDENDDTDNNDEDEEDQLIPYEGISQLALPIQKVTHVLAGESSQSSENGTESESSEEEQLIKIGGKYRKLSKILRGVLPELARRLSMFQDTTQVRTKRKQKRHLEPRKGLAIKKFGTSSAQTAELQRELNLFIDENQSSEDYLPNHERIQRPISDFAYVQNPIDSPISYPLSDFSSSSDSDSDSVEELFSDNVRDLTPSFSLAKTDPYQSYIDVDSESAQEMDQINHMFASQRKKSHSKSAAKRKTASGQSRSRGHSSVLRDLTNLPKRRNQQKADSGTLKRRKLSSMRIQQRKMIHSGTASGSGKTNDKEKPSNENMISEKAQKVKKKGKAADTTVEYAHPRNTDYKRDPIKSTTVFEVESATKFVHARPVRDVGHPETYIPSKELLFGNKDEFGHTSMLPFNELQKVHSIGDGHIFFSGENDVAFTLVGKHYSFGLYRLEASLQQTEKYFHHLRRLSLDAEKMLNPEVCGEMYHSLKMMVKWILIARIPPLNSLWRHLNLCLSNFTKLHTRQMRQHQSNVHARVLFLFYILMRIEFSGTPIPHLMKAFDDHCSDYWSVLFQSYSVFEFSKAYSDPQNPFSDSILLMYFMHSSNNQLWWQPMVEALQDSSPMIDDKCSLLDVIYVLASLVPARKYNWTPFFTILGQLKSQKFSLVFHHFIDIAVLVTQRLGWPIEERVITHLYLAFAQRKFGNFADETFVPKALGAIQTRNDLLDLSVFERFMGLLYTYISELDSKKEVKKLILKLLASSQYRHQKGRKFQIQFVNRINFVSLLFQVSDIDLSNQFTSIVELIAQSKDMFIYGRTFEALTMFCEIAIRREANVPIQALRILIERFCEYYDSLFGMPDLLMRAIQFVGATFQCQNDALLFELLRDLNLANFPDAYLSDLLSIILICLFDISVRQSTLTPAEIECIGSFQKGLISFLSTQMGRVSILEQRKRQSIEDAIEISIQLWMITAAITSTQHWNIIMLQRYPYIGSPDLREQFLPYICEEYMKLGPLDETIIGEIDTVMFRCLVAPNVSPYTLSLYSRLCRTENSVFCFKKNSSLEMNTLVQLRTLRCQLLSSVIQNAFVSSSNNDKFALIKTLVSSMDSEFSKHFSLTAYVDFCKQLVDIIQKFAHSVITRVDEFWMFADKLGLPNRKAQLKWAESSEIDKLQKINTELLNSLQFGKDLNPALDNWITASEMTTIFSLVQLYISAISLRELHWAHLLNLLQYVWLKLQKFQVRIHDVSFKHFLTMLVDVATLASLKNDAFAIYQLEALATCTKIYRHAFYVYDGYKDQTDFLATVADFTRQLSVRTPKDFEPKTLFTSVKFGTLRSHTSYTPAFQHTPAEYSRALDCHETELASLELVVLPPSSEVLDFDI